MKEFLKKFSIAVFLVRQVRNLFGVNEQMLSMKFHKKNSEKLIRKYLDRRVIKKLQIGAQSNLIDGWLNVDIIPKSNEVALMDATKPFPFPSNSIDYIFTEHMIEHISFAEAKFMIAECFRVLKQNGKIRISTPNLAFLIGLYQSEKSIQQQAYIDFSAARYFPNEAPAEDVYVINNFFKAWGHSFIHDIKSLSRLLITNGFSNIKQCEVLESANEHFRGLEQHGKEIKIEFNKLESLIIEATKQ